MAMSARAIVEAPVAKMASMLPVSKAPRAEKDAAVAITTAIICSSAAVLSFLNPSNTTPVAG
jgi:hypothetical protein